MSKSNTREAPVPSKAGESDSQGGFASFSDVLESGLSEALEKGIFEAMGSEDSGVEENVAGSGKSPDQLEGAVAPDEPEATAGDGGEAQAQEPEGGGDRYQTRIDELTAQKGHFQDKARKQEERIAELERQMAAGDQGEPAKAARPESSDPLADVTSQAQLQERVREAQNLEDWADEQIDLIDDGEIESADLNGSALNAKQLKGLRRNAKALQRKAQEKAMALAETEQVNQQANEAYAWLQKPDSRESQIHTQIMDQQFPELRNHPAGRLAVADMMVGMAARLKGRGQPAPTPTPPAPDAPAPTPAATAAPTSGGGGMGGATASAILARGGTRRQGGQSPQGGSPAAASAGNSSDLGRSDYAQTGSSSDLANLLLGQG